MKHIQKKRLKFNQFGKSFIQLIPPCRFIVEMFWLLLGDVELLGWEFVEGCCKLTTDLKWVKVAIKGYYHKNEFNTYPVFRGVAPLHHFLCVSIRSGKKVLAHSSQGTSCCTWASQIASKVSSYGVYSEKIQNVIQAHGSFNYVK